MSILTNDWARSVSIAPVLLWSRKLGRTPHDYPGVYLLLDPDRDAVKIGESIKPRAALGRAQVGNPSGLRLLHTIPTDHRLRLEGQLHERFRADWIRGEWFRISMEMRAFLNFEGCEDCVESERFAT